MSDASNVRTRIEPEAKKAAVAFANGSTALGAFLSQEHFRRMLSRERKRSERSRKHFVLMLIDGKGPKNKKTDALLEQIAVVMGASVRETDVAGWFETSAVFGVIFTEFGECEVSTAVKIIEAKMTAELQRAFRASQLSSFQISFYSFPDGWTGNGPAKPVDAEFYPDLFEVEKKKKLSLLLKRVMADPKARAERYHMGVRFTWRDIQTLDRHFRTAEGLLWDEAPASEDWKLKRAEQGG